MRQSAAGVRRGFLARDVMERRIHQHTISRARIQTRRRKGPRRRSHIQRDGVYAGSQAVARGIVRRQCRKRRVDIDQSDAQTLDPACQREAGGADARAEIDGVLTFLPRGCRRQQNGVVPDPMAAAWLMQTQAAVEHRVVADSGLA